MVIDSSALIALLLGEPESTNFVTSIAASTTRLTSASSYLETAIVMLNRSGPDAPEKVDRLLADLSIDIFPFTQDQAVLAIAATAIFFAAASWLPVAEAPSHPPDCLALFAGDSGRLGNHAGAARNRPRTPTATPARATRRGRRD